MERKYVDMQARRKKVERSDEPCNPEDTREPEDSGDDGVRLPVERSEPPAKDRHPMPWGLVIADVFHMDVHKTHARLVKELTLGDGATEYGTVIRAVDQSAKNLYEAARLSRKAKLEDEKFASELDKRLEVLRTAAQQALEQDKNNKLRSKAPTIKDIEDRMLATWPDEVTSIKARKAEMHGALRAIESLEGAWRDRCQSLRTLAQQFKTAGA